MHPTVVDTKYLHLYSAWAEQRRIATSRAKREADESFTTTTSEETLTYSTLQNVDDMQEKSEEEDYDKEIEYDDPSGDCISHDYVAISDTSSFSIDNSQLHQMRSLVSDINSKNESNRRAALDNPNDGSSCCPSSQHVSEYGDVEESIHVHDEQCSHRQYGQTEPVSFANSHKKQLPKIDISNSFVPIPYVNHKTRVTRERMTVLELVQESKQRIAELRPDQPDSINVFNAADFRTFEISGDSVIQMPFADVRINRY